MRAIPMCSALMAFLFGMNVRAEEPGSKAEIEKILRSYYQLSTTTDDNMDIATAGSVLVLQKDGLIMYATASPMPPLNTYKGGKISQGMGGFGRDLAMSSSGPDTSSHYSQRKFVRGEKFWIVGINVVKDGIVLQVYSDPYNDIRYYGQLKFPFDKHSVPSPDAALKVVSQVVRVATVEEPVNAAPPVLGAPRVTASSFLTPQSHEDPGFGLYSYILFGSRPVSFDSDRWRRYHEAIFAFLTIPSVEEASRYVPISHLNITFLPITCSEHELPNDPRNLRPIAFHFETERLAAHAREHQADGKAFAGDDSGDAGTACTLVSSYDYPRAQMFLSLLPKAHLEGPYIISTLQPLGQLRTLPAEYLYQDLSSVPPDLVGLWVKEFMAQAQEERFWKARTKEQFILRLRTAIALASQQIPDLGGGVTWAFAQIVK